MKHQTPNTKHQTPNTKHQTPNTKHTSLYDLKVKKIMDDIYSRTYPNGIYCPNEPIYGFRADEPRGYVMNYIRQYQILKLASTIDFKSVIDIGGGEGYTSFLFRQLFNLNRVCTSDISTEGCNRASEIFHLESKQAFINKLPFKDEEFDLVVCSETLEHVEDYKSAVLEILRICKHGVIITIPIESIQTVRQSINQGHIGDHINSLNNQSFDFTRNYKVISIQKYKMLSPLLIPLNVLVDANTRKYDQFHERSGYPRWLIDYYNRAVPLLRKLTSSQQASFLCYLDNLICTLTPWHTSMLFLLLKTHTKSSHRKITPIEIIKQKVNFHHLQRTK